MAPSIAPFTTVLAEALAKASDWRHQTQRQWRHHPAAATRAVGRSLAQHIVVQPLQLSAELGLLAAKALAEPAPWLARKMVAAGISGAQAAQKALSSPLRVTPSPRTNSRGAQLMGLRQDNQLRRAEWGAGLEANRDFGELIEAHPRAIRFGKAAYAQHLGLALPLKAAETMAEVAIGHAFPILTATTVGKWMFAGPEIAFLTPKTPEGTLFELGAALGLAAVLGDALGRTLAATNMRELDGELGERARWQRQFVRNQKRLTRGLKVLAQLEACDFERATRGQLASLDEAQKAASSLRRLGKKLAAHPSELAQLEAEGLAEKMAEHFAASPLSSKEMPASQEDQKMASNSTWQRVKRQLAVLEQRFQAAWHKGRQTRRASRLRARQHRLQSDVASLVKRRSLGAPLKLIERLSALRLNTELSLTHLERQALAAELDGLGPTEKVMNEGDASEERRRLRVLDALLKHPATRGGSWGRRLAGYQQRAEDLERRQQRLQKRAARVASAPTYGKDAGQAAALDRQRTARVGKIEARARQAQFAAERAHLDAALFALVDHIKAHPEASLAPLLANRVEALKLMRGEARAQADYLALRERQKRTSLYVAPAPQLMPTAPRLVRLAAESAWYTLAVMPGVNLPYWGARWGWAFGTDRLFAANLAAARRDAPTKSR